jgi:ribose transport system substrate-binding protein
MSEVRDKNGKSATTSEVENRPLSGLSRRKFLAGSAMAIGAAGLSAGLSLSAPRPARAAKSDETYVWLTAVTAIAFWIDGRQGFEAAGKALGVKTEFLGPVEYDVVAQLKILEELIARKPAGIMTFPADDRSLNEALKRAMKAGIPVVVTNHDVDDPSARYGYVGPDNRGVGRIGGKVAAKLLNGKGKIAFMTTTNPGHGQRTDGYKDTFAKYPGIEVIASVDEKSDPAYGLTVATQLILSHPELDMIIGIDATAGAATARALKETGKAGKILVGAMDRDEDMLPYIQDGTIAYTLAQNSVMEEWVALHYLYWLKHNSIPAFKDWRAANAPQCPWTTDIGVTEVTKENVKYFFHKK